MDVAKHHKSVYVVAFLALIMQAALSVCVQFLPMWGKSRLTISMQMVHVHGNRYVSSLLLLRLVMFGF